MAEETFLFISSTCLDQESCVSMIRPRDLVWSTLLIVLFLYMKHIILWETRTAKICILLKPGAIIRDGDRKRAPFLVLGLASWYGTIFLFLEQIAPSPSAHARTLLRGFSRMSRRGKWRPKFLTSVMLLVHNSTPLWLLDYFRRKLLQSEWRQCRI